MQVRVPAGVRDGQRVKLKGKGAPGERGGSPGDLYVTVHVTPDSVFGRSGDNLTLTVPVTFTEATLGAEIKVPTLHGPPVTLKLPPGTTIGAIVRGEEVIIAHHDTVIVSEDHVILFLADKRHIPDVEHLFQVGVTFF
jgi:DnaJ-class molecular chaperone